MTQRTQSLGPAQSPVSVSLFLLDSHHPPALACVSFHRELKHVRLGYSGQCGFLAGNAGQISAICPRREGLAGEGLRQPKKTAQGGRWKATWALPWLGRHGGCSCDPGHAHPQAWQLQPQWLPTAHCQGTHLSCGDLFRLNFVYNVLHVILWHFT